MLHPVFYFILTAFNAMAFLGELIKKREGAVMGWFCAMLWTASLAILSLDGTYKEGQIDALSGNVKFELTTNDTSEVSWKRIER
jgi:hypothetical protein